MSKLRQFFNSSEEVFYATGADGKKTAYPGSYFDAIVDASGQYDYTTLHEALDAGAAKIFVKPGTYVSDGTNAYNFTDPTKKYHLVGENVDAVIFDFAGAGWKKRFWFNPANYVGAKDYFNITTTIKTGSTFGTVEEAGFDLVAEGYGPGAIVDMQYDYPAVEIIGVVDATTFRMASPWPYDTHTDTGADYYHQDEVISYATLENFSVRDSSNQTDLIFANDFDSFCHRLTWRNIQVLDGLQYITHNMLGGNHIFEDFKNAGGWGFESYGQMGSVYRRVDNVGFVGYDAWQTFEECTLGTGNGGSIFEYNDQYPIYGEKFIGCKTYSAFLAQPYQENAIYRDTEHIGSTAELPQSQNRDLAHHIFGGGIRVDNDLLIGNNSGVDTYGGDPYQMRAKGPVSMPSALTEYTVMEVPGGAAGGELVLSFQTNGSERQTTKLLFSTDGTDISLVQTHSVLGNGGLPFVTIDADFGEEASPYFDATNFATFGWKINEYLKSARRNWEFVYDSTMNGLKFQPNQFAQTDTYTEYDSGIRFYAGARKMPAEILDFELDIERGSLDTTAQFRFGTTTILDVGDTTGTATYRNASSDTDYYYKTAYFYRSGGGNAAYPEPFVPYLLIKRLKIARWVLRIKATSTLVTTTCRGLMTVTE